MYRYVFIFFCVFLCIFASVPFILSVQMDRSTYIGPILSLIISIAFLPVNHLGQCKKKNRYERPESPNTSILRKRIQAMNWRVLLNKANTLSLVQEAIRQKKYKGHQL